MRIARNLCEKRQLPGTMVVVLALASCVSNRVASSSSSPPLLKPEEIVNGDTGLITGEPCAPPCWQNITPSVSSKDEALDALAQISFVDATSLYAPIPEYVYWESSTGTAGQSGRITFDGNSTQVISLNLAYDLTLQDMGSIYGDPDGYYPFFGGTYDYFGRPSVTYYDLVFVWFEKGVAAVIPLTLKGRVRSSQVALDEDELRVCCTQYFSPDTNPVDYLIATGHDTNYAQSTHDDFFKAWQDFDMISLD